MSPEGVGLRPLRAPAGRRTAWSPDAGEDPSARTLPSSTRDDGRKDRDAPLQQPRPRSRARLPAGDADGGRPRNPQQARRVVPQPSSAALTRSVRVSTGAALSEARATIDPVP